VRAKLIGLFGILHSSTMRFWVWIRTDLIEAGSEPFYRLGKGQTASQLFCSCLGLKATS